jgi:hypothetical protein
LSHKVCLSGIYDELKQLKIKRKNNPINKRANEQTLQKKKEYIRPINTRKDVHHL